MEPGYSSCDDLFQSTRSTSNCLKSYDQSNCLFSGCISKLVKWDAASPVSMRTRSKLRSQQVLFKDLSVSKLPNFSSFERHQLVIGSDHQSVGSSKALGLAGSSACSALRIVETDENAKVGENEKLSDKAPLFSTPGPLFERSLRSEFLDRAMVTPIPFSDSPNSSLASLQQRSARSPCIITSLGVRDVANGLDAREKDLPYQSLNPNGNECPSSRSHRDVSICASPGLGKRSDARLKRLTRRFWPSIINTLNDSYMRVFWKGDALEILLKLARQGSIARFPRVFTPSQRAGVWKLGEGSFSEVFAFSDGQTAVKLVPVEGSTLFNGETQKTFAEVVSEVIISNEVSSLTGGSDLDTTEAFVQMRRISIVEGAMPAYLVRAWEKFKQLRGSENDHPRIFGKKQRWIVLEIELFGHPLETSMPECVAARLSIFCQTALGLAVAERRLSFEHRDLHWGNLLVKTDPSSSVDACPLAYAVKSQSVSSSPAAVVAGVKYFPICGPKTCIVDFTLSRLEHFSAPLYLDLSQDEELFTAVGDHQFDIYREMREEVDGDWSVFRPRTNVMWLQYLAEKLSSLPTNSNCPTDADHCTSRNQLLNLVSDLSSTRYASAYDLVVRHQIFERLRRPVLSIQLTLERLSID